MAIMDSLVILVPAALCAALGISMIVSGNPRMLHSYHYATTPPDKLPKLARAEGAGLVGLAIGIALMGFVSDAPGALGIAGTIVGTVLFVASLAEMLIMIVYYNGGLMTFSGQTAPGPFATMRSAWRVIVCAIIGAALSLMGILPGVHMITTGDVSMLHSYHYMNVSPANLPRLATAEGACMVVLGIAAFLCVTAAAGFVGTRPFKRWAVACMGVGLVCLCAGLAGLLGFIIYYNGSLMGSTTL